MEKSSLVCMIPRRKNKNLGMMTQHKGTNLLNPSSKGGTEASVLNS